MKTNPQATNSPDVHFLDDEAASAATNSANSSVGANCEPGAQLQVARTPHSGTPAEGKHLDLKTALIAAAVVAVLGGVGWYTYQTLVPPAANSESSASPPAVVTVTTVKATVRPVDEILSVTGTVSSWDEMKVGPEVSGLRVTDVMVEEGDHVKKGEVLARLNAGLLEAQLAQAQARLKSSEASLLKSVQPNRPEDILGLKAALAQAESLAAQEESHRDQAKIGLESAELNVPRYEGLAKLGAVSKVEAETKRFARDTARLELASAEQRLDAARKFSDQARQKLLLAERGGRKEDVLMMKASVEETKAQIKHYSEQINQTVIHAPDEGVVMHRDVHVGDTSEMSKAFFSISRHGRLELKAQVNDTDIHKFKVGQSVSISTDEKHGHIIGAVRLISPQVDSTSRMGTVRIDVPENSGLKPGMFVKGEVSLTRHNALTVPVNCVVTRGGESFVFSTEGNRAVSTSVETGMQTDDYIEIKKGLTDGQLVIDKGARFLSDRDIVDIAH